MGGACSGGPASAAAVPSIKILLLGGANVGKSTIFKQMRILYKEGFEDKDRVMAKGCITENILETLIDLDQATDHYGVQVLEENEDLADELKPVLMQVKVREVDMPLENITIPWERIERLWSDPGIQAAFQEFQHPTRRGAGQEYTLPVLTGYFLRKLDTIKRDSYVPSDDDILHLRRSTSDSDTINFRMEVMSLIGKLTSLQVTCTDVGGQAHERTEWPKHAENLNAILYVVSLPEFSNVSGGTNVLESQLEILETVKQNEHFQCATIIVLLNKVDLLESKLQGLEVSEFFPEYQGANDINSVLKFFKQEVARRLGQEPTEEELPNIITSCATNTELMRTIIEKIGQSILQRTLSESKFFG